MLPITFKEMNFVLEKPPEMTDEQCMSLPVYRGRDADGFPIIVSCWKLSYEDLQLIQQTGCVYLTVSGTGMPPVSLHVETPFKE